MEDSEETAVEENPVKQGVWFKRLTDRLRATMAFKNIKKKSSTSANIHHLFSAPVHSINEDEDLKVLQGANLPVIWVLGGPGVPIQAFLNRLAKVYKFHHVIVGQILKNEIVVATGQGDMVNKLMHRGVVIPRQFLNEIIMRDMADAIERRQVQGFLFSDYPTTFTQAKTFIKKVQKVDFVIILKFDDSTMKLNAFQVLRRQSLSSKRLRKSKEELIKAAEEEVETYNKQIDLLYKFYGKRIKIIDGQLKIGNAYHEIMKWIERAMVIRNIMPPFLPTIPVNPKRFSNSGSMDSGTSVNLFDSCLDI